MAGGKNRAFMADPLAFMRKYSVAPRDDVEDYIGDRAVTVPVPLHLSADGYVFSAVEAAKKVAWLDFLKKPRGSGVNMSFIPYAEGVIAMQASFTPTAGKVKSYFLPWTAGGGVIHLSIPAAGTAPAAQDADYFFTAAITGCSIFIKGTRQAPTIYHAGGNTDSPTNPVGAATFWRNMMNIYSGPGAILQEVNKTAYISEPGRGGPGTANTDAFETWLKANSSKDLDIQMVFPWGCVMGVRDGAGDWTFYLQENATILFAKWEKKSVFSKTKVKSTVRGAARPMIFREIYPNGHHHVFLPHLDRKIL
jgi:hypothetical protein